MRGSNERASSQSLLQRYTSLLASRRAEHYVDLALNQRSKLQQLDRLMRNVVEQSFDGIMTFDQHGIVRTANEAACRSFAARKKR